VTVSSKAIPKTRIRLWISHWKNSHTGDPIPEIPQPTLSWGIPSGLLAFFWGLWFDKKKEEGEQTTENPPDQIEVKEQNPFVYYSPLSWWEIVKIFFTSLTIVPLKLLMMLPLAALAYLLARIGIAGLSPSALSKECLSTWRRVVLSPLPYIFRGLLALMGFFWVKTKGRASPDASLIISNYVSYLDPFVLGYLHNASFVVSDATFDIPVLGVIARAFQCLSLRDTETLANRVSVNKPFRPIISFPERVRTNGSHIITFSPTTFVPGCPVQPIIITYSHSYFDPAYPEVAPSFAWHFFRLLTQIYNKVEISYLPVLSPGEEEKDSTTFAKRVRKEMLAHSQLHSTSYSVDDARLFSLAMAAHFPASAVNINTAKIKEVSNLSYEDVRAMLQRFIDINTHKTGYVDLEEFSHFLGFESPTDYSTRLFHTLDLDQNGTLDFAEFLIGVSILSEDIDNSQLVSLVFKAMDKDNSGQLECSELAEVLSPYSEFSPQELRVIFSKIDKDKSGSISMDEFSQFVKEHPEYNILSIARATLTAKKAAHKTHSVGGQFHNRRY